MTPIGIAGIGAMIYLIGRQAKAAKAGEQPRAAAPQSSDFSGVKAYRTTQELKQIGATVGAKVGAVVGGPLGAAAGGYLGTNVGLVAGGFFAGSKVPFIEMIKDVRGQ